MDARADAPALQFFNKLSPVDAQPACLEPRNVPLPRVTAVRAFGRKFDFLHVRQFTIVNPGMARSDLDEPLEFPQLVDSDRRLDIGEVVLETTGDHFVIPVPAVAVAGP